MSRSRWRTRHTVSKGIAKDVNVQIKDHFILTDFMVLDMGEEDYDPPIVLGRPF